jgi:acyl-CoA synthetase (AMP-forming)/AMP-acid ligase II
LPQLSARAFRMSAWARSFTLSLSPRAGADIDAVALRDWLLARTERFKVPEVFHFRDVLPSGSSGKADRRAVAQLATQATRGRGATG